MDDGHVIAGEALRCSRCGRVWEPAAPHVRCPVDGALLHRAIVVEVGALALINAVLRAVSEAGWPPIG